MFGLFTIVGNCDTLFSNFETLNDDIDCGVGVDCSVARDRACQAEDLVVSRPHSIRPPRNAGMRSLKNGPH